MKRHFLYAIFLIPFFLSCAWHGEMMSDPDSIVYPALRFEPPEVQRTEFENGIILYFLEDHELPLVNLTAIARMGSFYDPPGKEGVAELTGGVMRTGGTASMTGDRLDEELDLIAGIIAVSVGKESTTLSLSVLEKDLDRGLEIFSDMLMNPVFAEEKVALAQSLEIEALKRIRDNPQRTAFREFHRLIYQGDPRGRLSSVQTIENIKREDLAAFHHRFFGPANTMIAVSGDVHSAELIKKIQTYLGKWSAAGERTKIPPPPAYPGASLDYLWKDTPQSVILTGYPAPGKTNPDYYAFEVLDFIVGSGGFRSRIFGEVRNRLGLAYSAGSFYSARPHHGIFGAYGIVKASSTVDALTAVEKILDEMRNTGAGREELEWAKKSILNNFIFSFSTPNRIVTDQMMLEYDGLPDTFLKDYKNNIEKVNFDDIRTVASRYLSEKNRVVLVLGDEKRFEKPLSSFGTFRSTGDTAGADR